MEFMRTDDGIYNTGLFFNEPLIYCEGSDSGEGDDEWFLKRIFEHLGYKARIEPRGSKNDVLKMHSNSNKDDLSVIYFVDRDYDDFLGKIVNDRNLIYTSGYSWENDLILSVDFKKILVDHMLIEREDSFFEVFLKNLLSYSAEFCNICNHDVASMQNESQIFSKENISEIIEVFNNDFPAIKDVTTRDSHLWAQELNSILETNIWKEYSGLLNFHGKSVYFFVFQFIRVFVLNSGRPSLPVKKAELYFRLKNAISDENNIAGSRVINYYRVNFSMCV